MARPVGLVELEWPDPNKDGSFTLTPEQAARLDHLLTQLDVYIAAQLARCGVK
jgi:hypothetical protein